MEKGFSIVEIVIKLRSLRHSHKMGNCNDLWSVMLKSRTQPLIPALGAGMTRFALLFFAVSLMALEAWPQSERGIRRTEAPETASSTAKVALVIGNAHYTATARLKNPVNDARAVSDALETLGFEVLLLVDADLTEMKRGIDQFGRALHKGGIGLFYYSGHGVQVKGRNYLIPVDAKVESEAEVEYESVDVGRVLVKLEAADNGMNIVILDACRNNPFASSYRSVAQGLATLNAPSGTFISYATAPGAVASDGTGKNGLFTGELIKQMKIPGLKLEEVFKRVRIRVQEQSRGKQVPWDASSLTGDFYFAGGSPQRVEEVQLGQASPITPRAVAPVHPFLTAGCDETALACVDWDRQVVMAVGSGAPASSAKTRARKAATAKRIAKLDAARNALEAIKGITLTSTNTVRDSMLADDTIRVKLQGKLFGLRTLETQYYEDESVEIRVEASLRTLIPPDLLKPPPQSTLEPNRPALSEGSEKNTIDLEQAYTGLVVNAKGIDLVPAMAPRILDESGGEVYGSLSLDPAFVKRFGMAGYLRSLEQALENDRVQGNPLVVNALNARGNPRADLVIANPAAAALRKLAQRQAFLKEARVVIVLD